MFRKKERLSFIELIGRIPAISRAREALEQFAETMAYAAFSLIEMKKDAQKIEASVDQLKVYLTEIRKGIEKIS